MPLRPNALEFACNAGNAGNADIIRRLQVGPLPATDVLNGILARYGGTTPASLQLLLVRIRGSKIVARGQSAARAFQPSEVIDARRLGYPTNPGLLPGVEDRLSARQVRFVEAHIDARSFMESVESGRGDAALRTLSVEGRDVLVIATIPTDLKERRTRFTMHPVALVIQ
jgi:hypothetical protein